MFVGTVVKCATFAAYRPPQHFTWIDPAVVVFNSVCAATAAAAPPIVLNYELSIHKDI